MDKTVRLWDVRPFVEGSRNKKTFTGAQVRSSPPQPSALAGHQLLTFVGVDVNVQHGTDKNLLRCSWSPDGELISAGSSDRVVRVWDVPSGEELYFLPGHKGTVNEVSGRRRWSHCVCYCGCAGWRACPYRVPPFIPTPRKLHCAG
jgi:Prp8 binding protein